MITLVGKVFVVNVGMRLECIKAYSFFFVEGDIITLMESLSNFVDNITQIKLQIDKDGSRFILECSVEGIDLKVSSEYFKAIG